MHPLRKKDAPVAQLVEHLTLNQGVQGSSPCGCTFEKQKRDAPVAQLVEHLTLNQGVQGSSPCGCTKKQTLKVCFFCNTLEEEEVAEYDNIPFNAPHQTATIC